MDWHTYWTWTLQIVIWLVIICIFAGGLVEAVRIDKKGDGNS